MYANQLKQELNLIKDSLKGAEEYHFDNFESVKMQFNSFYK